MADSTHNKTSSSIKKSSTKKKVLQAKKLIAKKMLSAQVIRGIKESIFFIFIAISIYLCMALLTYSPSDPGWSHSIATKIDPAQLNNMGGVFGAWFSDVFLYLFGYFAFLFPIMLLYSGWLLYYGRHKHYALHGTHIVLRTIGFLVLIITGAGLSSMHFTHPSVAFPLNAGGILGAVTSEYLYKTFSFAGATLFLLTLFLIGITFFTGLSWITLMDKIGGIVIEINDRLIRYWYTFQADSIHKKIPQNIKQDASNIFKKMKIEPTKIEPTIGIKKHRDDQKNNPPVTNQVVDSEVSPQKQSIKQTVKESIQQPIQQPVKQSIKQPIQQAPIIAPPVKNTQKNEPINIDKATHSFIHNEVGELPSLSLLDEAQPSEHVTSPESLENTSRLIEEKLADYKLRVEVVSVSQGPVITRFEIQLAAGIKVSQITNLSKDLARAMRVVSIRVVEVIAGKSTVGIEIPNEHREIVYFSDVLGAKEFLESKASIPLGLGHDISGRPVVADLAKMPHLLVAGTTGSGKSVGVNSMILSMLFQLSPNQLRLILVDPKMLELSIYEDIPHLLAPVVTDMKEAANALRWCVAEMERRYKLMAAMGVRNLAGFNKKIEEAINAGEPILDPLFTPNALTPEEEVPELETLPFIVIVIDEFADMMMIVGKKVEELIARLAQKARAAGLHLVIATQRPSVDVITGLIKANIPTRIGFQVSSKIDSRTILDQMGAENLLGHGDMLYLPPGMGYPLRVHGAFVSDNEVHAVVNDLKSKGKANYIEEILSGEGVSTAGMIPGDSESDNETDPLYDQAIAIVTESRKASISGLQRRLKVGYNRAARMVEDMEAAGVVSAMQSNGQREVIAPPPI